MARKINSIYIKKYDLITYIFPNFNCVVISLLLKQSIPILLNVANFSNL